MKISYCLPALFVLAACGGGGGNRGDNAPQFTSFSDIPANGSVELSGQTKSASFALGAANGETVIGEVQSNDDARGTAAYRNDLLSRLAIRNSGADLTVDEEDGGTFVQDTYLVVGRTADDRSVIALVDPNVVGFDYQSFGYWVNGFTTGTVAVGSFGSRTGHANMPDGTTATYAGGSTGLLNNATGDYSTESSVDVQTDFSDVTIVSSGTELYDFETGEYVGTAAQLDFTALGMISGDQFEALIATDDLDGSVDGQFYGPNATEVGGTFEASGNAGKYIGAFGAN